MLNQNTYIMSIQAKTLKYSMTKDSKVGYSTKGKKKNKLYSGSLPWSLDMIHLDTLGKKIFYQEMIGKKEKQYSDAIVNVKFDCPYFEKMDDEKICFSLRKGKLKLFHKKKSKVLQDVLALREDLYQNGFCVNGKHYTMYKRSSSKARLGSCLFILDKYHSKMMKWSRMGLKFNKNEKFDLASLKAYESLTLSAIIDTLQISPEQILLIKDVTAPYESISSVMTLKHGEPIITTDEHYPNHSDIWDGQSLLDESMFAYDDDGKQKGMMLLRNRFFKSCAFNTKLQKYLQDYYGGEYETKIIKDMCGNDRKVTDIRLVITPNSLKIFKFQDKLKGRDNCYQYWLDYADTTFGICKSEKKSHYDTANQLSYQMINSMNFSLDDMKRLVADEEKYVAALKNDISVFMNHINNYSINPSREFIFNLLSVNSDAQYTNLFKRYRTKTIEKYVDNLKCGKIKIKDCDYAVLFSNPYEMLRAAVGEQIAETLHHKLEGQPHGTEVYCPKFEDGEKLWGFRNPHICAGNCAVLENKKFDEFDYFNLTENIVIINTFDNDLADRLQGADEDSDVLLIGNSKLIYQKAFECQAFPTPVKNVDLGKTLYTDSWDNNAKIDDLISNNYIGQIVNWSQLLNSYYWENKSQLAATEQKELLSEIYDKVSMLSSMSQLEIDRAKKYYSTETLDISKQLDKLSDLALIQKTGKRVEKKVLLQDEECAINKQLEKIKQASAIISDNSSSGIQKEKAKKCIKECQAQINRIIYEYKETPIKPLFMKAVNNDSAMPIREFETPMDYLQSALKFKPKKRVRKKVELHDILCKYNHKAINYRQIPKIYQLAYNTQRNIDALWHTKLNKYQRQEEKVRLKQDLADELTKLKTNSCTITYIIENLYCNATDIIKMKVKKISGISKCQIDSDLMALIIENRNEKQKKKIKPSKIRMLLYGALWKSHNKEMKQCFINNKRERVSQLVECEITEDSDPTLNFWGKQYKRV